MNQSMYPVKRNQELILKVERAAFGGKGLARVNDYVIFIKNAIPGDVLKVRITRRKPNYAEARILELQTPSPLRIQAPCPYFDWCGGCTWQNLDYTQQLRIKREHVAECLNHLGDVDEFLLQETLPSPKIWGYRNKMEFSFSDRRWLLPHELGKADISRNYALGLHIPGTFDKILDVDFCFLQSETSNAVLQIVDHYVMRRKLQPYGIKSHEGFLRFLVIRESTYNSDILVNLVTAYRDDQNLLPLAELIRDRISNVCGVVNTVNASKAQIATGEREYTLAGKNFIIEKLGPFEFKVSANSFFQTNTLQAKRLFQVVLDYCGLRGSEVVWDLYSGTGTISMLLSIHAKTVIGFEMSETAIADAESNVKKYGITNMRFVGGDIAQTLHAETTQPDVIIVDPPRAGMHPKVCAAVTSTTAQRLVYVSCNPATLARDLQTLKNRYKLITAQPVDMFPHTYHIETVCLLEKRE